MTGSSMDGLDIALVRITGNGLDMSVETVLTATFSLDPVVDRLRSFAIGQPHTAGEISTLSYDFSLLHREAIAKTLEGQSADLIVLHGQTVYHSPPYSWQMINPSLIAYPLHIPVVYDLRSADLALGGEGAPITPIADLILFRHPEERRAVVNLGGFINYTILEPTSGQGEDVSSIKAGDLSVCNQLLDRLAVRLLNQPYDRDGEVALAGTADTAVTQELQSLLERQSVGGRSLGTGDEQEEWIGRTCGTGLPTATILRSACRAIALNLSNRVGSVDRLLLAGGGANNRALLQEICDTARFPVVTTGDYGRPVAYREAVEMAILGALCQDRLPITLSQVTGVANPPIAGCWVIP